MVKEAVEEAKKSAAELNLRSRGGSQDRQKLLKKPKAEEAEETG